MSEKITKTYAESVESALEIMVQSPNKQKHNSKRRTKKNKARVLTDDLKNESNKIDDVVNYLCNTISKNGAETLANTTPVKISKKPSTLSGNYCDPWSSQNSKFDHGKQAASTSAVDLNIFLQNLQVCAEKTLVNSDNVTNIFNPELLKKKYCEFEQLKFKKLKEKCCFKKLNTGSSKNAYKEFFNVKFVQNCSDRSFLSQLNESSHVVPKPESLSYPTNENFVKNNHSVEYFDVTKLPRPKNNFMTSITFPPNPHSKKLKQALENESSKKNKLPRRKNKNLRINMEEHQEVEIGNDNQKIVLNAEFPQDSSGLNTSNPQNYKKGKKQTTSKSTNAGVDNKYPKHLSANELHSLSDFGVLLTGIIRINPKNYKEAYITAPDKGIDILIEGLKDRNRALEGDEVYFVLKAKEHHRVTCDSTDIQRTAVVVGLKTLNHDRGAIGSLNVIKNKNNSFVLFSPRDSKLPRLRIPRNNWPKGFLEDSESFKDKLYFAKISQWNDLRYAEGELIKEIGLAGDLEVETEAILLKHGLNVTPYGESLKKFLPPTAFKILDPEVAFREDFRKDCVFTIDPDSAVDLDDAVSCKKLPSGNYEVGVHISDVSYFLTEGTPLDHAVSERATTVYLVQKAYHMLPFELCRLCSLTPGEDKLSFSVLWEVTPDCKIVKHRFTRSVINSCAQFSYNQVQSIIDNVPVADIIFPKIFGNHSTENIKEIIFFLHKVAVYLRNKRFNNGALKIDQKKIHFSLDENRLPIDYKEYCQKPSHQMIEEFMLLANITVAEQLNQYFPDLAFLRSHPPPLPYVLKKLQKTLEKYGIILNISSSKSLQSSLLRYSGEDYESVARSLVLNSALAKPMSRAKYYCAGLFSDEEDRRHYALCVPLYTHFTSPIRRYADVMVHRLLAASLQYCDPPNWTSENVQQIAENCNKKKYSAKLAEEMSVELYHSLYIGLQGRVVCEAVVCDIKDKSFDCIGLTTGIHQRLYFEHVQGRIDKIREDGIWRLTIKWPTDENNGTESIQIIEMFSIVKIELKRISVLKIEANLLRNE